jgi:hypothetical protein
MDWQRYYPLSVRDQLNQFIMAMNFVSEIIERLAKKTNSNPKISPYSLKLMYLFDKFNSDLKREFNKNVDAIKNFATNQWTFNEQKLAKILRQYAFEKGLAFYPKKRYAYWTSLYLGLPDKKEIEIIYYRTASGLIYGSILISIDNVNTNSINSDKNESEIKDQLLFYLNSIF